METATVYGFGSFFRRSAQAEDIDLLIVHRSNDPESCRFAIDSKKVLSRLLPEADIVMLSLGEANQNNFIARALADKLGVIDSTNYEAQLSDLCRQIHKLYVRG